MISMLDAIDYKPVAHFQPFRDIAKFKESGKRGAVSLCGDARRVVEPLLTTKADGTIQSSFAFKADTICFVSTMTRPHFGFRLAYSSTLAR